MTTPGSMALAFRLFSEDRLRVRALTLISTVGLVGLAVGPPVGGLVLLVAPWQVLVLANAPIAALAAACIAAGIPADRAEDLHPAPIDLIGAVLGTATIALALLTPTLFASDGAAAAAPWLVGAGTLLAGAGFVRRQHTATDPLIDLALLGRPPVAAGLALKAAVTMAVAGLSYLVTLQLQLVWYWTPAQAALGMLPQVVVLLAGGLVIGPLVARAGPVRASWLSAAAVVGGLALFTLLGRAHYVWVASALVLVAAGLRVVGVVAATTVMQGLPADRTTLGAALLDTAGQLTAGIGAAVAGTILAVVSADTLVPGDPGPARAEQLGNGLTLAAAALTVTSAAITG